MASLQQIISWFQTGLFPTAEQFRQTWLSYWHKSEKIPQSQIFGLKETIESATRGLIYQNPVPTQSALVTTYPNAEVGWAAMVLDEGRIYSFNGTNWANTGLVAFPNDVADEIAQLAGAVSNRIPLSGTEPDKPVTGDVVFSDQIGIKGIDGQKISFTGEDLDISSDGDLNIDGGRVNVSSEHNMNITSGAGGVHMGAETNATISAGHDVVVSAERMLFDDKDVATVDMIEKGIKESTNRLGALAQGIIPITLFDIDKNGHAFRNEDGRGHYVLVTMPSGGYNLVPFAYVDEY